MANIDDQATIDISLTANRQLEWNVASATITGTIQWTGQSAKAITGAIAYRETLNNRYFYDWTYNAADRPSTSVPGVVNLSDGTTSVSIPVAFFDSQSAELSAIKSKTDLIATTRSQIRW